MIDEGEATPEINVRVDGLDRLVHLPDDEDEVAGGPGVELAGLDDAAARRCASATPPTAASRTAVRFSDLALRFPAFVLPLRQASGVLRFPYGGLAAEDVARRARRRARRARREVGSSSVDRVDVEIVLRR